MGKKSKKNTEEQVVLDVVSETTDESNDVQLEEIVEETPAKTESEEVVIEPIIEPEVVVPKEVKEEKIVSKYPNIDDSFSQYLNAVKSSNFSIAIKSISSLFHNLAVKGDEKQLDYVLNLFKNNKENVLDFKFALNAISDLNKTIRLNTEIMFTIYNKIINNTPNMIDYNIIRSKTKNEKLIIWIQRKIKK